MRSVLFLRTLFIGSFNRIYLLIIVDDTTFAHSLCISACLMRIQIVQQKTGFVTSIRFVSDACYFIDKETVIFTNL